MANIIIADVCNMQCRYCFAGSYMETANTTTHSPFISLDDFAQRLDFLNRSGIDEIRLIGGEPTLHPQFAELIQMARKEAKHIVVFTHGLIRASALACLEAIPADKCTVLVNTSATAKPGGPGAREVARRKAVIRRLGQRALLGYTIDALDNDLGFLIPLVESSGAQRKIRLGLAQPISGGQNIYLHPKQYPAVGQKIIRFAEGAAQVGIQIELDCGFVRCMFTEQGLEVLHAMNTTLQWRCSPILDLALDGTVMHCFSTGNMLHCQFDSQLTATDFRQILAGSASLYRVAGIYRECSICRFKLSGDCAGGCLAAALMRFQHGPSPDLTIPAGIIEHKEVPLIE
jgi:sulfatase maturation enzyme AslB (radical SAM superfamily)